MRSVQTSLLLSLLAGCGQILGVDEYHVPSTALDATTPDAARLDAGPPGVDPPDAAPEAGPLDLGPRDAGPLDAGRHAPNVLVGCGRLLYGEETCGTCMETSCCAEAIACANDPVCASTQGCYSRCASGDSDCRATCNGSIPYDVPAERALERCLVLKCVEPCQVECGGSLPLERARAFRGMPSCCEAERQLWSSGAAYKWQECQRSCFWPQLDSTPGVDACQCLTNNPGAEAPAAALVECAKLSRTPGPDWSCVGHVEWPRLREPESIQLHVSLIELLTSVAVPDITLSACGGYDACATPLSPPVITDAGGKATLTFAQRIPSFPDFYSYLRMVGPKIPETLYHFQSPAPIRQSRWDARSVLPLTTVKGLYDQAGEPQDPTRGSVGVQIWDCNPMPAAGIRVELQEAARVLYSNERGGVDPQANATSGTGHALVLNVKPGTVRVTFTHVASEQTVATFDVLVRAGAVTIAVTSPTPMP